MRSYRQKILVGGGLALCLASGGVAVLRPSGLDVRGLAVLALLLPGLAAMAFAAFRAERFGARLRLFLRRLLAGNYATAVRPSKWRDEVSELEELLGKLSVQLQEYDRLRAERVRGNQRIVDMVLEYVPHPVMLVDVERDVMECNPAAQKALGTNERKLKLGLVENSAENAVFAGLLRKTIETDRSPQKGVVRLQLPGAEAVSEIGIQLQPVKDQGENVKYVLILESEPPEADAECPVLYP